MIVHNRASVTMKIEAKIPVALRGVMTFSPDSGFVQSNDSLVLQFRFNPSQEMWSRCVKLGFANEDTRILNIQIPIHVPDQVIPVYFDFKAHINSSEILVTSLANGKQNLEFGPCYLGQSNSLPIQISNTSSLLQKVMFTSPKDFDVQPFDGLVSVLPNSSVIRNVIYSPSAAIEKNAEIVCKTSLGQIIKLPLTSTGI